MLSSQELKELLVKNENGFYEINGLMIYARKEFNGYLKIASNIKSIRELAQELGFKIELETTNYLKVSSLKEIEEIILVTNNPRAIYLHPRLLDSFLEWINLEINFNLINFLKSYKPKPRKKKKGRGTYTKEQTHQMLKERLRGASYAEIGKKYFCHQDTAREIVLSTADEAKIHLRRRQRKKR